MKYSGNANWLLNGSGRGYWQDMIMLMYMPDVKLANYCYAPFTDDTETRRKAIGIFTCPASPLVDEAVQKVILRNYGINFNSGQSKPAYCSLEPSGDDPREGKLGRIRYPSQRAGMFDINRCDGTSQPGATELSNLVISGTNGVAEWRHYTRKGVNVCFADGHVVGRTYYDIPETYLKDGGYFWNNRTADFR